MAASPYDQRKKTRRARLDDVRQKAQARMQTVARLERRGHYDTPSGPRPIVDPPRTQAQRDAVARAQGASPKPKAKTVVEGRTGPAEVINASKFRGTTLSPDQTTRQLWRIGLGPGQRADSRGTMVVKHSKKLGALQTYYRRKKDGKAIPIDQTGKVIRRRGVSP